MALQTKMFKSSTVNYYHTELTLTENNVNVTDNTSSVSYKLTLYAGGANFYDYSVGHTVVLAGKTISASYRPNAPQYSVEKNSSVVIASGTTTVAHNSDGTLNMSVAFSISIYKTDYTPGDISVSGVNMALTTIARASTIGATDANIESTSIINVSKKSDAYMHSIRYEFGSLTGYLDADGDSRDTRLIFPESSIAWKIPKSFYAQIPNAKSGVCTLTCTTYSVSGATVTQIGEAATTQMTITAAYALCAPEVSGTVYDVNEDTIALTGTRNMFVRYYSTARCILSASAKNDASISGKYINGVQVSEDIKDLPSYDGTDVKFRVEDSRGYASDVSVATTLIAYVKLTNNAVCNRTDPTSGNATLTFSGNYYNGGFGAKQNALTLKYKIDSGPEVVVETAPTISNHTYSLNVPISGLTYNQSHTVVVTVSDLLSTVSIRLTVKKGIPVFDWGNDDFAFHVPVTLPEPTESNHAATKKYVDNVAGGGSGGTGNGDKVVLVNARIDEIANTSQTFNASLFISTPQEGDSVLGTNGYVGIVTVVNGSQITVTATGEQWVRFDAEDAVPKTRTVNGKALSEDIVLSAEDVPVGKSNVEAVLTSIQNELNYTVPVTRKVNDKELSADITLGAGDIGVVTPTIPDGGYDRKKRYRSCDTVQKFIDEFLNSDLEKLIFLQADVPETADGIVACDDESLCFPRMPDEGEYVVGKNGYIGQAELDENGEYYDIVSTGWRLFDFGDATKKYVNEQVTAGKQYTDNQVKYGYIDKTRDFASQGTYDDVQEYLMSLGEGRWMFNSSFEQHTEDMHCAYLVECVEFGSLKYWTVQEFLDDFSRSIRLYNNLSDDDTPVCVFEFYGDVGEEIGSFLPFPVATPTKNGHATTKKYVDDKFAALDYIDKTEEYNAKVTAEGVKAADLWLRTLTDGKYKVSNADEGELTLCDNFALSAVTRSATGRFCISRFYKYSGTVSIAIYFDGDELFRMFGDSGDAVSEGTFFDYVNERVPYCNTAGKVLTAKGDGSTEWTTPSGGWKLIGEVVTDGTEDTAGVSVAVNFAEWSEVYAEAVGTKDSSLTFRVLLSTKNNAWYDGQSIVSKTANDQTTFSMSIKNILGELKVIAGYNTGYSSGSGTLFANNPRASFAETAYKYIRFDTQNTGAMPADCTLKVWGKK